MDVTFLFLDESVVLGTAWLTGVFVPAECHAHVRDCVIRIAQAALAAAGHEFLRPTELHGVSMLRGIPGATNEHRLKVFNDVADLVNQKQLQIVSIGHSQSRSVRKTLAERHMDPGDKMYYLNFGELVDVLDLSPESLILPVFDGGARPAGSKKELRVDHFAYETFIRGVYETHWHRVASEKKPVGPLSYKPNLCNLGEPTFSDSSRSPLLQLVDVVGYMLIAAQHTDSASPSDFKTEIAGAGKRIEKQLVYRREISTNFVAPVESTPTAT